MITKVTGRLLAVAEDVLTLAVGAFEYEVLIPEFTRRQLQGMLGEDVSLHTIDYFEGNPMHTPRAIAAMKRMIAVVIQIFDRPGDAESVNSV